MKTTKNQRFGHLEASYVQQLTHKGKKLEWVLYNDANEEIYRFPAHWDEKTVMAAIHFGRKFEMDAFNRGVEFQKSKNPKTITDLQAMVRRYEGERGEMISRNEMLAGELENLNKQLDKLTINN